MRSLFATLALLSVTVSGDAQDVIRLRSGAPATPQAEVTESRFPFGKIVRNVSDASLTAYLPDPAIANGTAVIVAPGGGFHMLSIDNEGVAVARWLNSIGITAFVLKYRLVQTDGGFVPHFFRLLTHLPELATAVEPLRPAATADGEDAVRYVRANAARFGVNPNHVGLMGFSAGGAVTVWTMLANHSDSRPDFAAAIYPGLLPDPIVAPKNAPPLLVLVADDDTIARGDSGRLEAAWRASGARTEFVTYPKGGHGFGMKHQGKPTDEWAARMRTWLQSQGMLTK